MVDRGPRGEDGDQPTSIDIVTGNPSGFGSLAAPRSVGKPIATASTRTRLQAGPEQRQIRHSVRLIETPETSNPFDPAARVHACPEQRIADPRCRVLSPVSIKDSSTRRPTNSNQSAEYSHRVKLSVPAEVAPVQFAQIPYFAIFSRFRMDLGGCHAKIDFRLGGSPWALGSNFGVEKFIARDVEIVLGQRDRSLEGGDLVPGSGTYRPSLWSRQGGPTGGSNSRSA